MEYLRTATVNGTAGNDLIDSDYVDADGHSLTMFTDNDNTSEPPDHVILDAGAGDDRINTWLSAGPATIWRDHVTLLCGDGNDTLNMDGFDEIAPGTIITMDGGAGDDVLNHWWPDPTANLVMTGGSGADTFSAASFEPGTTLTISDFEIGRDMLTVMTRYESWETITAGMISADGPYRAHDTADGLRIEAYHYLDYEGDVIGLEGLMYTFTLTGVTLSDFMSGSGVNTLDGTDGRDIIREDYVDADGDRLSDGENLVLAGAGNDTVTLTMWNSTVRAGDGRDFVVVRGEGNTVYGEAGDDHLIARQGSQTLDGGAGDDRLVADIRQGGDHVLTGGEGADSFDIVFGAASRRDGNVVITDFDSEHDVLLIDGTFIDLGAPPDGVTRGSSADGWMVIYFGLNDSVELVGQPAFDPLVA